MVKKYFQLLASFTPSRLLKLIKLEHRLSLISEMVLLRAMLL